MTLSPLLRPLLRCGFPCLTLLFALARYTGPLSAADYASQIAPIFEARCVSCHDPDSPSGGLNLKSYRGVMAGGSSGQVVTPGDATKSRLYRLVAHQESPKMPPEGPRIPDAELQLIREWIQAGAKAEGSGGPSAAAAPAAPVVSSALPPPVGKLDRGPTARRPSAITALASSPDGRFVAVAGQREILLYDQTTLAFVDALPFPEGIAYVLKFSPQGELLLAGGGQNARSGRAVVWSMRTGERLLEVGDESDVVLAADLSPDQTMIALGGPKKKLKIYSTRDGALLRAIDQHSDWITSISYSPDGVLLASADRAGKLYVWESLSGQEYAALAGHAASVNQVAWRSDANVLASVGEDGQARLWDIEHVTPLTSWAAHAGGARGVAFAAQGQVVLTCGRDASVKSWNTDGSAIKTIHTNNTAVLHLAVLRGEDHVLTGDLVGFVRSVEYATGNVQAFPALKPDWSTRLANRQPPPKETTTTAPESVAAVAESPTVAQEAQPEAAAATEVEEVPTSPVEPASPSALAEIALPTIEPVPPQPVEVAQAKLTLPVVLPPAAAPVSAPTIEPTVVAAKPAGSPTAVSKAERRRLRKKYLAIGAGIGTGATLLLCGGVAAAVWLRRKTRLSRSPVSASHPPHFRFSPDSAREKKR